MRPRSSAPAAALALVLATTGCGDAHGESGATASADALTLATGFPENASGNAAPADQARAAGEVLRDCPTCPEMSVVPAGTFVMGSAESEDELAAALGYEAQRTVTIGTSFAVGVYEVTFDEWEACAAAGGCRGYTPDDAGWGRGRRPVINVSWSDALAYAEWLTEETGHLYRLPTEAEWEYVARAGTATARYWGESADAQCEYANGFDLTANEVRPHRYSPPADCTDGYAKTAPVGSFPANGFGLHDVLGNVWEWTEDCWSAAGAPSDGSAVQVPLCEDGRVKRGGSWGSFPHGLRSAQRRVDGRASDEATGFRVVRELD